MAVEFEVNPNTTMRTFNFLQEKGIIYNRRGIGYYVSDDGYEKTLALKKERFIREELPAIFSTMQLLGISLEDVKNYHTKFSSTSQKSNL